MNCSICFTPLTQYVELSCHHQFHLQCINIWLHQYLKDTCPICRNSNHKIIKYFPSELFINELYQNTLVELTNEFEKRRVREYYQNVMNELLQ